MNIKQLEYFCAVAEQLSFTKAAQSCYISQTALSLQIKSLEERLGLLLFARDRHHVALTAAGKVYYEDCKDILARLEIASKKARAASEKFTGSINIGYIRGYEHSNVAEDLRRFHESFPDISLRLIRNNMSALYTQLLDGECDLCYTILPFTQELPDGIHKHFLKRYPMMCVMSIDHPLAHKGSLTYSDLKNESFIIVQPQGRPMEEIEEATLCYERGGFMPNIVSWSSEVQNVIMEASVGLGITILPEYAVRFNKESPNLSVIPLVDKNSNAETLDFGLCWNENHHKNEVLRYLSHVFPEEEFAGK